MSSCPESKDYSTVRITIRKVYRMEYGMWILNSTDYSYSYRRIVIWHCTGTVLDYSYEYDCTRTDFLLLCWWLWSGSLGDVSALPNLGSTVLVPYRTARVSLLYCTVLYCTAAEYDPEVDFECPSRDMYVIVPVYARGCLRCKQPYRVYIKSRYRLNFTFLISRLPGMHTRLSTKVMDPPLQEQWHTSS